MQTDIDLTKKGEAYAAAALAEANGVFFLTVDGKDRSSIATSIEKLINMLDDLDPDPDIEPALGWTFEGQGSSDDSDREHDDADMERTMGWERGSGPYDQSRIGMFFQDEVEAVSEDEGAQCDDEGVQESGVADKDALELLGFLHDDRLRFDGRGTQEAQDMLRQHREKGKPPRSPHANVRPLTASDFKRLPWA